MLHRPIRNFAGLQNICYQVLKAKQIVWTFSQGRTEYIKLTIRARKRSSVIWYHLAYLLLCVSWLFPLQVPCVLHLRGHSLHQPTTVKLAHRTSPHCSSSLAILSPLNSGKHEVHHCSWYELMPFRTLGFNCKAIPMLCQVAETRFSSFFTSKRSPES